MTINEIAEMAGVSRATVSRYLNDGYVSKQKAERIRKVIAETGYTPSVSAKLLRSNHTNLIGVIIPKISSDSISRMVNGISNVLMAEGYQMLLACTNNNEADEVRYLKTFSQNNVDGIILFGTVLTQQHYETLKEISCPVIVLTQKVKGYSCIYSDDFHAGCALGRIIGKTAKNVGMLLVTDKDIAVGINRRDGLIQGLRECNVSVDSKNMRITNFTMESGYAMAKDLFKESPDLDTIICATDTIAAGAIQYLHEIGKSIPKDVQVSGFGDSTLASALTPTLSTIHFHYEEAGKEGAELLLEQIRSEDNPVLKEIQLAYDTVIRESTR